MPPSRQALMKKVRSSPSSIADDPAPDPLGASAVDAPATLPVLNSPLAKAQLLQTLRQMPEQKQLQLFSAWMSGLGAAQFSKVLDLVRLENDLRQELGGLRSSRSPGLTDIFLKSVSHRRRNSTEMTPPQLYVYIRRRRKSSESGTKYLGKLFFVPGGHTYRWKDGTDGSLVFYEGNTFRLTHLRTKEERLIRLVRLDQPPPDYDYEPKAGEKPSIQVGLHVERLHPQTLQPVEVKIYDYPSCLYERGELSESLWQVEPLSPDLPVTLPPVDSSPPLVLPESLPVGRSHLSVDRADALKIVPMLRQFRDLSQTVHTVRSHWYLSEPSEGLGGTYALTTASGKLILEFDTQTWQLRTEHSAPVLARWFHSLCSKVQAGFDQGKYAEMGLGDRKALSDLFVHLQTVRGKSVNDILRLLFQLSTAPE